MTTPPHRLLRFLSKALGGFFSSLSREYSLREHFRENNIKSLQWAGTHCLLQLSSTTVAVPTVPISVSSLVAIVFLSSGTLTLATRKTQPGGGFTYRQPFLRPQLRSHHLFYRKGLLWLFPFKGKSSFYVVLIFALFLFAVATLVLQSSMTLAFRQGSERGRLLREGLKFGSTLRFVPGRVSRRFVEGDGLDRARKEARIGVRPPRLALILGNMKKDPQSLMLITVMKNIKKLGYELKCVMAAPLYGKRKKCKLIVLLK